MSKDRIGIIFGGPSEEHDVSLQSAAAAIRFLNSDKHLPVCIGINRRGEWKQCDNDPEKISKGLWEENARKISVNTLSDIMDFALPMMHGRYGEDGCVQGLFEILRLPYGGCGIVGCAAAMDKQLFRELMKQRNIPVCRDIYMTAEQLATAEGIAQSRRHIRKEIGFPCFIKPANMGSSIGISKVHDADEFDRAVKTAALYDRRILAEEYIPCRELETAIIWSGTGRRHEVSGVGEIISSDEFYDYEAKYSQGEKSSRLITSADISSEDEAQIRRMATEAFEAIDGYGFARVDFFKHRITGRLYINEINTLPGFTSGSMFPLLWRERGFRDEEILERIIGAGYERYYAEDNRKAKI